MMSDEEIKKYLPQYLSAESYDLLLMELKNFPTNIDSRFYTSYICTNIIYQGDGLDNMPIVNISNPDLGKKEIPCIVLSNTCDISPDNSRYFSSAIMYAPIISLEKYINTVIKKGISSDKIQNHLDQIKKQRFTQILYLPESANFPESIVFLDRIFNVDSKCLEENKIKERRIFSLSNYGFYMFLFKLSVHFSRIQEKVDRDVVHP